MFGLGPTELIIIVVAILVLFGSTKVPQFFRSLGQAKSEFEAGTRDPARAPLDRPADADPARRENGDPSTSKD